MMWSPPFVRANNVAAKPAPIQILSNRIKARRDRPSCSAVTTANQIRLLSISAGTLWRHTENDYKMYLE